MVGDTIEHSCITCQFRETFQSGKKFRPFYNKICQTLQRQILRTNIAHKFCKIDYCKPKGQTHQKKCKKKKEKHLGISI